MLWANPRSKSPKWSEDDGLIVRRKGNPREATLEAWGLDALPVGSHFGGHVYDDIIEVRHVRNPEVVKKTIENWELSLLLKRVGGWQRYIGTRYSFNDPYREIMQRGTVQPRLKPATAEGTESGKPVFMTPEELTERRRDLGLYTFGAQMLQDPSADKTQGFQARMAAQSHHQHRQHRLAQPLHPRRPGEREKERQRLHRHGCDRSQCRSETTCSIWCAMQTST